MPAPDYPEMRSNSLPRECWACDHYTFRASPPGGGWSWAYCDHWGSWFERYRTEVKSRKKETDRLSPGTRSCQHWKEVFIEPKEYEGGSDYIPRLVPDVRKPGGKKGDTGSIAEVRKLRARGQHGGKVRGRAGQGGLLRGVPRFVDEVQHPDDEEDV